jgi:hypothetical protein
MQGVDFEGEEDLLAIVILEEWAVAWTASVDRGIIFANKLIPRFLAGMENCWCMARVHNRMQGLVTVKRLKLGNNAGLGGIEAPDLQTKLERLDEC